MEEGIGSWFDYQQSNEQSPNLNILNPRYCLGQQNTVPSYMNPCSKFISMNDIPPAHGSSGMLQAKASQPYEPRGWFYCLPRFRQAFSPVPYSAFPYKNCRDPVALDTQSAAERFLVFDQSGDQTTIFSSGINCPVSIMPSWRPKPSNAFNLYKDELENKRDAINPSRKFSHSRIIKHDYETDFSEMHEDTEELDALLYSDGEDDYSEDEEEASTGHSPSTPPCDNKRIWFDESEEVASSARPAKKQRVSGGGYDVPSLMDTASSLKSKRCIEYEDDAESSCGNRNNVLGESDSVSVDQRSKIEKIRRTISILESIIPDGKGKDSIAVIDDAIHYLRTLKDRAKVLGLDGLNTHANSHQKQHK